MLCKRIGCRSHSNGVNISVSLSVGCGIRKANFAQGETRHTQPTQILGREGINVAVKDFTVCPRCQGAGFKDDGTTRDLCHGAGEIEVHDTPDDPEEEQAR